VHLGQMWQIDCAIPERGVCALSDVHGPFSSPPSRYPATMRAAVDTRSRRTLAVVLLVAAGLIAAYWIAWLAHRPLVASESGPAYTQFEDAFPLADGWLALCLVAASFCLLTARRAALFWLLAGGGAGLYLFGMDVLYDLQHGVWGKGGNGAMELVINLVTLGLSLYVLWWAWTRRDAPWRGADIADEPG
jgi:hypothetical protein